MKLMPPFLKHSFFSFLVALIRIVSSFVTNKILAVILGPVSFAMVGQFQNIMMAAQAGGSLSLQNGWVSLTAQYADDEEKRLALWRSGLILSGIGVLLVSFLFLVVSFTGIFNALFPAVSEEVLKIALLCTIPGLIGTVTLLIVQSVANGFSAFKLWAFLSISAYLTQALWVICFVLWNQNLVLIALATQSLVTFFISLFVCFKKKVFSRLLKSPSSGYEVWKKFAWMGILPMILMPLVLTAIRSLIGTSLGWDQAGLWQGAFRISDFFNVIFASVLGVVLIPRLSKLKNEKDFFKTLWHALLGILLIALILILGMILFKEMVIQIILSKDFLPISSHMPIQWIGDFFRCGSWCLGLGLIVKQAAKMFLFLEILSQSLFLTLSFIGISYVGLLAPFAAYAIENALCFLLILLYTIRNHYTWKPL